MQLNKACGTDGLNQPFFNNLVDIRCGGFSQLQGMDA